MKKKYSEKITITDLPKWETDLYDNLYSRLMIFIITFRIKKSDIEHSAFNLKIDSPKKAEMIFELIAELEVFIEHPSIYSDYDFVEYFYKILSFISREM